MVMLGVESIPIRATTLSKLVQVLPNTKDTWVQLHCVRCILLMMKMAMLSYAHATLTQKLKSNKNSIHEKKRKEGHLLSQPPAQLHVHPQRKMKSHVELCKTLSSPVAKPHATSSMKKFNTNVLNLFDRNNVLHSSTKNTNLATPSSVTFLNFFFFLKKKKTLTSRSRPTQRFLSVGFLNVMLVVSQLQSI